MRISREAMVRKICLVASVLVGTPLPAATQNYVGPSGKISVVLVADPYSDTRTGPELVEGPSLLMEGGIEAQLYQGVDLCLDCKVIHDFIAPSVRLWNFWNIRSSCAAGLSPLRLHS